MQEFLRMIAAQAAGHLAAGIGLALADRILSRPRPESARARLTGRLNALKLLEHLAALERGAAPPGTTPIEPHEVREACAYIRHHLPRGDLSWAEADHFASAPPAAPATASAPATPVSPTDESVWSRIKAWLVHQKLNPHRPVTKLKIGYGIEVGADLVVALSAAFWGRGNFFGALGHTLYQGAAMGIGLVTGGFLFGRREHRVPRRLRKQLERLEERLEIDRGSRDLLRRIAEGKLPELRVPVGAERGGARR